jgi:hypothetical protein
MRAVRQAARAVFGERTTVHGLDVRLHDHPKTGTRDLQVGTSAADAA